MALATETARKLDLVLGESVARTSRIAADPIIVEALEKRRDQKLQGEDRDLLTARLAEAWEAREPQVVETFTQGDLADLLRRYYAGTSDMPHQTIPVVKRAAKRALYITDSQGALVASINADAAFLNADEP